MAGDLRKTLLELGSTLQAGALPPTHDPRATIRPAPAGGAPAQLRSLGARGVLAGRIELGEMFAGGGMGILRKATQLSLNRSIAVKSLREERRSDSATLALLHEAWITGQLEHPNVVPIYDLGLDAEGSPLLLLRRIEGMEWSALLDDPAGVRNRFKTSDPLAWHLGVLMQVSSTVSFAHSKGILHRDLKPENVIIGAFGEVYVLDWGIAVALNPCGDLPLARNATQLAGTPCYMAPEMLGDPSRLSERTDVYLLGAMLYELIEGRPPHPGTRLFEILRNVASASSPTFSHDSPAELVAICKRALDARPERRFASAEDLRLAIASFLEHRGSATLAVEAHARLAMLLDHLARGRERGDGDPIEIDRLFGECRFGFEQALSIWPLNEAAAAGLRTANTAVIEHELAKNDARSASRLVRSVGAYIDNELRARVEAAVAQSAAEEERLRALAEDRDLHIGSAERAIFGSLMGVVWVGAPLMLVIQPNVASSLSLMTVVWVVQTVAVLTVWFAARRMLARTLLNRAIGLVSGICVSIPIALQLGASWLGVGPARSFALLPGVWSAVLFTTAIVLDKRHAIAGAGYLIAFLVGCLRPELCFYLVAAGNLVVALVFLQSSRSAR